MCVCLCVSVCLNVFQELCINHVFSSFMKNFNSFENFLPDFPALKSLFYWIMEICERRKFQYWKYPYKIYDNSLPAFCFESLLLFKTRSDKCKLFEQISCKNTQILKCLKTIKNGWKSEINKNILNSSIYSSLLHVSSKYVNAARLCNLQ